MPTKNKNCPVRKCPWGEQLNDELSFLIACCQTDPSDLESALNEERKCPWGEIADTPVVKTKEGCDDINFIHSYLSQDGNQLTQNLKPKTQNLLALASSHGILPLVYKTIKKLHTNTIHYHWRNFSMN